MTKRIKDFKLELLKQEIKLVDEKIKHFDDLRHRTKQLAITLWLAAAGVGAGVLSESSPPLPWVLILAAFVPLPFWLMDANYHRYQEGYTARSRAIRDFLRDGEFSVQGKVKVTLEECLNSPDFGAFPVPDYYGKKTISAELHRKLTGQGRNFATRQMVLFYLPLVVAAFALFLVV